MMLHAALHWPDTFDILLWPFAVEYACWIWNNTPKSDGGLAPVELFSGSRTNYKSVRAARVWGCPAYILHPTLQDDNKLPKWDPRSKRGLFLGFSKDHALTAGCILNLQTGRGGNAFSRCHVSTFLMLMISMMA